MAVAKTYRIRENFIEGKHPKNELDEYQTSLLSTYFSQNESITRNFPKIFNKTAESHLCLKVERRIQNDDENFCFETSYFIGAQWLIKGKLPLLVEPKFNKSKEDKTEVEIDYIKIMTEALEPSENAEHLKDLVFIDFQQTPIKIKQKQDLLSPLLIIQFIHLLKKIVKKGLKNSYYKKHSNLRSRVRGKILISATVKHNHTKSNMINTYCSYDEFGIDHQENRLLKKALSFADKYLCQLKNTKSDFTQIDEMFRFIKPAFQNVSEEINTASIKNFQPNPMFKEYNEALKLAKLILKRFGYNLTKTSDKKVETPPFWIDMSKLFELYVLSLLRKRFPSKEELLYQPKISSLYPDYLIRTDDGLVVDAKYKNYSGKNIAKEDFWQISGYARLEGVYSKLYKDENDSNNIKCLFIYPDLKSNLDIASVNFTSKLFKEKNYRNIYSIGVRLPTIN
jgi:5-methylcytosine-specific restriction enzyme subunit McrC